MSWTKMQELSDPDVLEELPVGSVINDNGLRAFKAPSGAWCYGNGQFWEPMWFPCLLLWVPEFGGEPPRVLNEGLLPDTL